MQHHVYRCNIKYTDATSTVQMQHHKASTTHYGRVATRTNGLVGGYLTNGLVGGYLTAQSFDRLAALNTR